MSAHPHNAHENVTIVPPRDCWARALAPRALTPAQRRFREELGLPLDAPVVMSGHQAEAWHPGIAAKWFALTALARRHHARAAWVVVDHDDNDPTRIGYPTHDLRKRMLGVDRPAMPTASRAAEPILTGAPDDCAAPAREGLSRLLLAVNTHASAPTLAEQYTRATLELLGPHAQGVPVIFASRLARTTLFRGFARALRTNPAVTRLYNQAITDTRRAGHTRPLAHHPTRGDELPLWRMHPSGARLPVYANDPTVAHEVLAPRALLLTAMLRSAGCELFIHGVGGGAYDRVTDRWLALLREGSTTRALVGDAPAPTCIVSATRHLRFPGGALATPQEIAHAAWLTHRARFDPLILADRAAAAEKAHLLHTVATAPTRADKLAAYRALHAALAEYRAVHAEQLEHIDVLAQSARMTRRTAEVVFDRTWPFPYYPQATLDALARDVEAAL